jgi:hypothetical protein
MSAAEAAGHRPPPTPRIFGTKLLHHETSFSSDDSRFAMVARQPVLGIARNVCSIYCSNGFRRSSCRRLATAAVDSEKLPLAGIRVLDMTRVLAGVWSDVSHSEISSNVLCSRTALKF